MDLPAAICNAGVKAILDTREIWGTENVDVIREEFISALMAVNLHESLGLPVRTERLYTEQYRKLGFDPSGSDIRTNIGGLRADIVIYDTPGEEGKPLAIIEYKIFAEGGKKRNIVADLRKGDAVELRKHIKIYLVVLICERAKADLDMQKAHLNEELGRELVFSPPEQAPGWKWCFGCWELPFTIVAVA
jgi:hypothetical protein